MPMQTSKLQTQRQLPKHLRPVTPSTSQIVWSAALKYPRNEAWWSQVPGTTAAMCQAGAHASVSRSEAAGLMYRLGLGSLCNQEQLQEQLQALLLRHREAKQLQVWVASASRCESVGFRSGGRATKNNCMSRYREAKPQASGSPATNNSCIAAHIGQELYIHISQAAAVHGHACDYDSLGFSIINTERPSLSKKASLRVTKQCSEAKLNFDDSHEENCATLGRDHAS